MPKPQSSYRSFKNPVQFFGVLIIFSAIIFVYPLWRLSHWLDLPTVITVVLCLFAFSSQLIARVLLRGKTSNLARILRISMDFLIGVAQFLLFLVFAGEFLLVFTAIAPKTIAFLIIVLTGLLSAYGLYKAWQPRIVNIELKSAKISRSYRFAQISDVHIGSRNPKFLQKIIHQINAQKPDFLCITGDFIDQPGITAKQLEALTQFSGKIYFCIGNHEKYEDLDDIIHRLENLGVIVLRNKAVLAEELQVIGIDDSPNPQQVAEQLPKISIDDGKYLILLYHRPHGLADASEAGVDLKLSGHTHNGQIKPFNLAVNRVFQYRKGRYDHTSSTGYNTILYVNEGTGTWGPTMRLGTQSEITLFDLKPNKLDQASNNI